MMNKFLMTLSGAAMLVFGAGCGSFVPADYMSVDTGLVFSHC